MPHNERGADELRHDVAEALGLRSDTSAIVNAVAAPLRIAAVLFWCTGLGFGLSAIPVARYFSEHGEAPRILGIPAFGGGPFDSLVPDRFVQLLIAFFVLGVLETVAGGLLWAGLRSGAILGLALLPVGAIFWVGFFLPVPPLLAIARTALVLLNWESLRPGPVGTLQVGNQPRAHP